MKREVKVIFHIDLNAFYASVSIINEPYLKNKVFVVGGSNVIGRGIITTASYKARRLGITSGMSVSDAQKIYPKLLIVPTNHEEYRKYSNLFFEFLNQYSDYILRGSIDEAYLDVTELSKKMHPLAIAKDIQKKLLKLYNLPCSIGIAPTLFLAKMASDLKKPLGITVVRKRDIPQKILPLPIKELYGMGIKTYPLLIKKGIKTIGDFTKEENKEKILEVISYDAYQNFLENIWGESTNKVDPTKYDIPKSISNETTFNYIIDISSIILEELTNLLKRAHKRLIKEKMLAKTITLKFKYDDFKTITRSKSLEDYTNNYDTFLQLLETLFYDNYNDEKLRLVGVGFSNLILKEQYTEDFNLFTYQRLLKSKHDII